LEQNEPEGICRKRHTGIFINQTVGLFGKRPDNSNQSFEWFPKEGLDNAFIQTQPPQLQEILNTRLLLQMLPAVRMRDTLHIDVYKDKPTSLKPSAYAQQRQ
jgi:hypothetical protein